MNENKRIKTPIPRDSAESRILTGRIIQAAYVVHRSLGPGLAEAIYVRALARTLTKEGIQSTIERRFGVFLESRRVGEIRVDLDVEDSVLVEVKSVKSAGTREDHQSQILSYLRVSKRRLGLVLNFGSPKLVVRRFIFSRMGE